MEVDRGRQDEEWWGGGGSKSYGLKVVEIKRAEGGTGAANKIMFFLRMRCTAIPSTIRGSRQCALSTPNEMELAVVSVGLAHNTILMIRRESLRSFAMNKNELETIDLVGVGIIEPICRAYKMPRLGVERVVERYDGIYKATTALIVFESSVRIQIST